MRSFACRRLQRRILLTLSAAFLLPLPLFSQAVSASYVSSAAGVGRFPLAVGAATATLVVSGRDFPGVRRAATSLQSDIARVTGQTPGLSIDTVVGRSVVLIGTLGKSPLIDRLVADKKLDVSRVRGKWETFVVQSVEKPMSGVDHALVITGSDKRGTIFGIYDLSSQIGVSPWYWFADVPTPHQSMLYVLPGAHSMGEPTVKYRGLFINDEAPALSGMVHEKFGNFNHQFYEHVFELILRLKGNYLWPAMWGNAFNDDDKLNPVLADEYGVVMGTSHHEPMLRAQQEWKRYGKGPWNYEQNADSLKAFWRQGIVNMGSHESIVTVGMRGDGDMPMSAGANIALLERIVADQRKIISEVTGKPAEATPQLWALYKEVQDYYDQGMRVPADVTLLFADDNWGNIRRLPKPADPPRAGGYGIYYHFDYVGGPRNYKWTNTNQISRVWEQMQLAYNLGVNRIWIVNVGDIKPMEFPLSFWFAHAWNPSQWSATRMADFPRAWAAQQFGSTHALEIGDLLTTYTRYNSRRKPELLSPMTYSLTNYNEANRVVADYNQLAARAEAIGKQLAPQYRDAYYQLVLYPIQAAANLNDMYVAAAKGNAARVGQLFKRDAQLSAFFNDTLAGGKWHHMADQTHIGYTSWQEPRTNVMPAARSVTAADTTPVPDHGGYVSIEAAHFTSKVGNWLTIPDIGRTLSGVTYRPVTAAVVKPGASTPHLEYRVVLQKTDSVVVHAMISPTLDFNDRKGLRFAVSFDGQEPQIVNAWPPENAGKDNSGGNASANWERAVSNNIIDVKSAHHVGAGPHVLKVWLVEPGVVLQKIVIDEGGLKPSYLGPPENYR